MNPRAQHSLELAALDPRSVGTRWLGRTIDFVEETASTNDDIFGLGGAAHGHVIVADRQTAGRGSHGRAWVSPPGEDLYVSFAVRPRTPLESLPTLTLAVGLGVADASETVLRDALSAKPPASELDPPRNHLPCVQLKWPNDLWIDRRKSGGILVESRVREQQAVVVVGIGLNVNRSELGSLSDATSLRVASGHRFDRAEVLGIMLRCIEPWVDRWERDGPAPVVDGIRQRLALLDERVRVDDLTGTVIGVDSQGALLLRDATGRSHAIRAGRLEPLRAAPGLP